MKFIPKTVPLLFFLLTLVLALNLVKSESDEDDCPDLKALEPCKCDRQGLSCYDKLDEATLATVFSVDFKYKAYRSVWINGTPLKKLPRNAFNGYRIFNLLIEENALEVVEAGAFAGSYKTIREISFYDNQITSFPFGDLAKMTSLDKLSLASNNLTSIPMGAFDSLPSITGIDLSENQIKSLPPSAFEGLLSLQAIILNDNRLKEIPRRAFANIENPFQLQLADNEISYIDPTAFLGSAPGLIDLSGNQLQYLDPNVFERPVRSIGTVVDVYENPLTCSGCSRYRWLLNISPRNIANFQCQNGRQLTDLTPFNIGCIF